MIDIIINPIHTAIFVISFFGIVIGLLWIYFHKNKWGYGIAPLTYFVNVFLYNATLHFTYVFGIGNISFNQLEIWSGVVRLHALFLLIALLFLMPPRRK